MPRYPCFSALLALRLAGWGGEGCCRRPAGREASSVEKWGYLGSSSAGGGAAAIYHSIPLPPSTVLCFPAPKYSLFSAPPALRLAGHQHPLLPPVHSDGAGSSHMAATPTAMYILNAAAPVHWWGGSADRWLDAKLVTRRSRDIWVRESGARRQHGVYR